MFQSYDWVSLWRRNSAAARHTRPFVAVARRHDGRPAMVFPLGIRGRFGCRMLVFLGGAVDYNAPVIDPAVRARQPVDDVNAPWRQIAPRAGVAWLSRMPETFPDGGINPMIGEAHAQHTDNAYAAMPLPRTFAAKRSKSCFAADSAARRTHRVARPACHRPPPSQIAELIQEEPDGFRMTPEFPAIFAQLFEMFIDASAGAET